VVTFAATSDHFRVKWIRIEGLSVLDEATIRDRCGITQENNVIFLNAAEIRRRVESIPHVKECTITCVFPDTVVIRITERNAVATVLAHNKFYSVDAEGHVLEELGMNDAHPGPLIGNLADLEQVEPGRSLDRQAYRDALAAWEAFSQTEAARGLHLSDISARAENDIRMYFDDLPYELRWGRGDFKRQAKRLDILWRAKEGKLGCQQYLDLRFGEDIVCK
jgi:cell division septal protein FtsQ